MDEDELKAFQESCIILNRVDLEGADFSGRETPYLSVAGSRFTNCRFESMRISDAALGSGGLAGYPPSVYVGCSFDGTRVKSISGWARFERCSFRKVMISGWSLDRADVVDCVFTGTMKAGRGGGTFWGAPPPHRRDEYGRERNEFRGNDFSGCRIVGMDFRRGADLRLNVLPVGPDYLYVEDGAGAVERAWPVVEAWADEEDRRNGLFWLGYFRTQILNGQEQVFMAKPTGKRKDYWPQFREVMLAAGES